MAAPAAPNIATAWCRAQLAASACSYRQDPGGLGDHRSQHDQHIGEKEQPQHLPVQRLARPSQPAAFCAPSGEFTGISLLGCSSAPFGTNTPEYCFLPGPGPIGTAAMVAA